MCQDRDISVSGAMRDEGRPYETEKVQPSVGIFGMFEAVKDHIVFVELTFLDRYVDPDDILPHDTPRTDI
jgi:hypothetical protein